MADLFEQFGVQTSSSAPPPTAPDDETNGVPAARITPKGSATEPDTGGTDLFADQGIAPPTVSERNSMAIARFQPIGPTHTVNGTLVATSETPHDDAVNAEVLAQSRFTPEQIAEFKANPITWGQAQNYLDFSDVLPGGGVAKGYELIKANQAAGKLERGEELSPAEQQLLYGIVDKNLEMNLRGFTVGGGIKYYGLQMPAFMTEFILSGGIGKLAEQGAVKSTEALAIKGIENSAIRSLGNATVKAVGATANITARTAVMPSLYLPQYGERRLNDEVSITDKGDLLMKQSEESPAKSALMAFAYSSANVASELAGGPLQKYVTGPIMASVKTPLIAAIDKVPAIVREGLYNAYKTLKPNAKVADAFTAAGWNGMLNELGENRIQDVLNATIGAASGDKQKGPKTFDEYLDMLTPSKDQLLTEAGIIAIAGGVKTSADISLNLLRKRGVPEVDAREMVSNMTANEQEAFVSKHLQTPQGTLNTDLPTSPEAKALLDETRPVKQAVADGETVPGNFEAEVNDLQLKAAEAQDPPRIDNSESFFDKAHREWVNELEPIQALPEQARARGREVPISEDTKLLSTAYAGTLGAIRQNLQVATFTKDALGNNVVTGKGLKPILDDFSALMLPHEPSRDVREQDFGDYLVARRYLEDLSGRDGVEVSEKQKLDSLTKLSELGAKYGDDFRFFDTMAKEVYGFQQRILHNLVDSGVMSEESFNDIVKANPNYIPFDRVLEEPDFQGGVSTNGVFTKANANRIVKTIKGSEADVKGVFNSVIKNTARIIDMSRRNEVGRSIANLADALPEYIQKIPTPVEKVGEVTTEDGTQKAIFRPSQFQPKDTIVVRNNGKREFYKVSKPILDAVESIGATQLNFVEKIFQASASLLRAGATLVPEFWVRNVIRDQHTALLQSGVKYKPTDFAKGLWAVLGKTELYNEWERSGGSFNSYMELDDKGLEKAYKELFRTDGRMMRYLHPLGPIRAAEDISGVLEQATRVGVFNAAKREGQASVEAQLTSRDATLNFARKGSQGKRVNRYIPFFNAGVQGSDKFIRTFKTNPAATVMWGLSTITLPSVALAGYYLYGAPEKDRQEYLEIPQWQKDMFWVFKVGDDWHRVPKPFTYGYLFGSMPERMMQWMYDGNKPEGKDTWLSLVGGLAGSVSPVYDASALLPPLVKTSIESVTNYNFFTGRNIYPEWMNRLDPEQRYNKYTSETAKAIGTKLGVSPAMVDNALKGQLAGSADYVTRAGDWILDQTKEWNGETVPEKPLTQSDKVLIRAFAVRRPSGYRSQSAQDFFENLKEVGQRHATFEKLEGKEQQTYEKTHARELDMHGALNNTYKEMKSIQDEIDTVYDDPKMAGERKVSRINRLEDQITRIARDANRNYNKAVKGNPR